MAELLTALSILLATLTWLVTYFRDSHRERVAHTVSMISALSTSDRLSESTFEMTKLINAGVCVSLDNIDPSTEAHVVNILDYYEFLSELYFDGVLNKTCIENLRGRLMRRTWAACERYIADTRLAQKRLVYSSFERFVRELRLKN